MIHAAFGHISGATHIARIIAPNMITSATATAPIAITAAKIDHTSNITMTTNYRMPASGDTWRNAINRLPYIIIGIAHGADGLPVVIYTDKSIILSDPPPIYSETLNNFLRWVNNEKLSNGAIYNGSIFYFEKAIDADTDNHFINLHRFGLAPRATFNPPTLQAKPIVDQPDKSV